ncbi:unnamed protein product [Urochloa humidicola]
MAGGRGRQNCRRLGRLGAPASGGKRGRGRGDLGDLLTRGGNGREWRESAAAGGWRAWPARSSFADGGAPRRRSSRR